MAGEERRKTPHDLREERRLLGEKWAVLDGEADITPGGSSWWCASQCAQHASLHEMIVWDGPGPLAQA